MIAIGLQIAEVAREIAMRKRVFPAWVRDGRMTQEESDRRIATLEAVRETLLDVARMRDEKIQPPLL